MTENNTKDSISVLIQDMTNHPHCRSHGPALLFSRRIPGQPVQQFFACSAVRDRNACPIMYDQKALPTNEELMRAHMSRTNQQISIRQEVIYFIYLVILVFLINNTFIRLIYFFFNNIQIEESTNRICGYCAKCQSLFGYSSLSKHADHEGFQSDLSKEELQIPTRWLRPLNNDSKEAQYFFSDTTLNCLAGIFISNNFRKIICVGAPRLYEYLSSHIERLKINTILLDLDDRLELFYDPKEYFRYNMFNNHFLDGQHRSAAFKEFLTVNRYIDLALHKLQSQANVLVFF